MDSKGIAGDMATETGIVKPLSGYFEIFDNVYLKSGHLNLPKFQLQSS